MPTAEEGKQFALALTQAQTTVTELFRAEL
jgi:hypothetical protein